MVGDIPIKRTILIQISRTLGEEHSSLKDRVRLPVPTGSNTRIDDLSLRGMGAFGVFKTHGRIGFRINIVVVCSRREHSLYHMGMDVGIFRIGVIVSEGEANDVVLLSKTIRRNGTIPRSYQTSSEITIS